MPANAGIQKLLKILGPGVRRDDASATFYSVVLVKK